MDKEKLKELMQKGLIFEVIGSWLWATGKTYENKESLKELGFLFSKSKKAWFYNGSNVKEGRGYFKDLNELRDKWGYAPLPLNN